MNLAFMLHLYELKKKYLMHGKLGHNDFFYYYLPESLDRMLHIKYNISINMYIFQQFLSSCVWKRIFFGGKPCGSQDEKKHLNSFIIVITIIIWMLKHEPLTIK